MAEPGEIEDAGATLGRPRLDPVFDQQALKISNPLLVGHADNLRGVFAAPRPVPHRELEAAVVSPNALDNHPEPLGRGATGGLGHVDDAQRFQYEPAIDNLRQKCVPILEMPVKAPSRDIENACQDIDLNRIDATCGEGCISRLDPLLGPQAAARITCLLRGQIRSGHVANGAGPRHR